MIKKKTAAALLVAFSLSASFSAHAALAQEPTQWLVNANLVHQTSSLASQVSTETKSLIEAIHQKMAMIQDMTNEAKESIVGTMEKSFGISVTAADMNNYKSLYNSAENLARSSMRMYSTVSNIDNAFSMMNNGMKMPNFSEMKPVDKARFIKNIIDAGDQRSVYMKQQVRYLQQVSERTQKDAEIFVETGKKVENSKGTVASLGAATQAALATAKISSDLNAMTAQALAAKIEMDANEEEINKAKSKINDYQNDRLRCQMGMGCASIKKGIEN